MKNQYAGDINDYRKYGLIDVISKVFSKKILFVWMLTHDENNDGNKIEYLNKPHKYRQYNEMLFDELKTIVANRRKNNNLDNIIAIENSNFLKEYKFIDDFIEDDKESRTEYFEKVYKLVSKYDTIFFDPDNGIEIPSCKYGNQKSSKFIYWREIENIYNLNKNILIYQHFPRKNRESFSKDIVKQCKSKLKGSEVIPIMTKNVLFIFITTHNSKELIKKLKIELDTWKGEMELGK
jgi:hypothetical protein